MVPRHAAGCTEQSVAVWALRLLDLHRAIFDQQCRAILERAVKLITPEDVLTEGDAPPIKEIRRYDTLAEIDFYQALLAFRVRAPDRGHVLRDLGGDIPANAGVAERMGTLPHNKHFRDSNLLEADGAVKMLAPVMLIPGLARVVYHTSRQIKTVVCQ